MGCRKILMNIAVSEGAKPDQSFVFYVEWLSNNHYVPPRGKTWVDAIRKRANDATHQVEALSPAEASQVFAFTEALLGYIFELPTRLAPTGAIEFGEPEDTKP